jgi:hypothetical protein
MDKELSTSYKALLYIKECAELVGLEVIEGKTAFDVIFMAEIMKRLREEQESKTGRWEWVQYDYNPKLGNWHCSECRCIVVECVDKETKGGIPLYKYCPQCGAKMESEVEENGN